MNYFSVRTNDQETISAILNGQKEIEVTKLSWHRDKVQIEDIVFLVISGDSSKKELDYENGLRAIGIANSLPKSDPVSEKHFSLDIKIKDVFSISYTKDDFYNYPDLKDTPSIGPETKNSPNQAFQKLTKAQGQAVIAALEDLGHTSEFITSNKKDGFKLVKLIEPNKKEDNSTPSIDLFELFINWFIKKDGSNHNYYTNNFSENKDDLTKELEEYKKIFEDSFGYDLFFINQKKDIDELFQRIKSDIFKKDTPFYSYSSKKSNHMPRAILGSKNYLKFLEGLAQQNAEFDISNLLNDIEESGLIYERELINRFVSSLITKPFAILTGLSGSGKTKLAQAFAQWICADESQYRIVPVGADWTNREPLLGFPNALDPKDYVKPESGVLDLIMKAEDNESQPYFLILDEMNLSQVERYFADFLSVMESDDYIKLHEKKGKLNGVSPQIKWPNNLFIIGTVNIDETTYMFSPKVLDRANTIEFRVREDELNTFFDNGAQSIDLKILESKGQSMAQDFLTLSEQKTVKEKTKEDIRDVLIMFFNELKENGAEFGYRSTFEILLLIEKLGVIDSKMEMNTKLDIVIMQKLLPKLHGGQRKIVPVLEKLGQLCLNEGEIFSEVLQKPEDQLVGKYPLSLEKIVRMHKRAVRNGYTSFAEA